VFSKTVPFLWLAAVAAAYLAPALAHGLALGPYDILGQLGITAHPGAVVHNLVDSDEIEEFIPWQVLSWTQVHAGHLPLWNPYSLLGLPLAFNFQSAPFSLAVAVGYLFPLRLAHSAAIVARLLIAGSGTYVLCRVLRLRTLSALFAATIYELSGGLTVWLGTYEAGCLGWLGWVFAASVLVCRGEHRARDVSLLALALAFLLYAGEPQIALLAICSLGIFAIVMTVPNARAHHKLALRPLIDHVLAVLGACALAAPVYLPGLQLIFGSARTTGPPVAGLPLYDLTHLIFGDYNGLPTSLSQVIGPDNLYVSMIYVGVIGAVLALVALALVRERVEVIAFSVLTGCVLVLLFVHPIVTLMSHVAYLDVFRILLATTLLDFTIAVLAGFGCEALLARGSAVRADRILLAALAVTTVVVIVLEVRLAVNVDHLTFGAYRMRAESFIWPGIGIASLVAVAVVRSRSTGSRHRAHVGELGLGALLLVETAFLISSGAGLLSSTSSPLSASPSVTMLSRDVGSSLIGIGSCATNVLPDLGIAPNANLAYGIAELDVLDPVRPSSYNSSYGMATRTATAPSNPPGLFCAAITSVALAREYGVSYVLEPPGANGPVGTTRVATLNGEGLFKVPDSSRATLVALGPGTTHASRPRMLYVTQPSPTSWRVTVDASAPSVLRLRLTDVPGWDATIDGRPLALRTWDDVMLQADVPQGRYVVELIYRPRAYSIGLILALCAALALVSALCWSYLKGRSRAVASSRLSERS
jgi:hypothetical protein